MKGAMKVCFNSFLLWMTVINKMGLFLSRLFDSECGISTLYMMGEDDKLFLPQVYSTIAHQPINSSLVVVPNAGHACNIENKEFFNKVSIEYLLA